MPQVANGTLAVSCLLPAKVPRPFGLGALAFGGLVAIVWKFRRERLGSLLRITLYLLIPFAVYESTQYHAAGMEGLPMRFYTIAFGLLAFLDVLVSKLSSRKEMDAALAKLRGRSRAKRTMWSRRAQEYQAKIASGDPASIAEVVRDLFRNTGQPEQSYSERQIYQAALDRFVREYAAVERIDETTATERVEQMLSA